ncbi:MAG: DUF2630 family protein [bacterium]|nr:DUF2630 family protein [bacterium]
MDELHQHIEELIAEEHSLRGGHVDPDGAKRIESLERQLDQAWDLLRQRDALRRAGVNPDEAQERPESEVEGYLQ